MTDTDKRLYLVHAVDTEGPLYQSPKATILRLNELFDTNFDVSVDFPALQEIIEDLKLKKRPVGGREEEIAHFLSTTEFLSDKTSYARSIRAVTSPEFRQECADPQGGWYRWNWFVLDNVATLTNPRRRLFGYGQVYVNLREAISFRDSLKLDGFYWHYHQMRRDQHPFIKETNFFSSDEYNQILCRYIIEHRHFPAAYRAGYCLERWDANLFLENWIPFDYSNQAPGFDFPVHRRVGEELDFWLRAPKDWSHYHPDSRDCERPGDMRRTIFRSLCFRTRLYSLTEEDVRQAFQRADQGQPTVLSTFSHDFRPLEPEARGFHELVVRTATSFPEVQWRHATAVEAARAVLGQAIDTPLELELWVEKDLVYARSSRAVFGSEPYLALMTVDHRFFHQNFIKIDENLWAYHLRRPEIIHYIGLGACDATGESATALVERREGVFHPVAGTGYWSGSPE